LLCYQPRIFLKDTHKSSSPGSWTIASKIDSNEFGVRCFLNCV
jgi:hypothetical protein